ncbi:SHOCT domain-containing protein [Microbacterium thalassium]|uniref:ABC-type multidrug transport system fused ATPase/permease subunit n=1 Tax=Microbacterium thalassium TaxID=362649 RepID=A0A7X0FLP2_9MICO|nr:SHOCT domain-containing protein [Microbacterium thalassium]MBB6389798.1 ABC-type multidrug transport system fused ATPase/permease subunit [Microbacterium thalassium]GLK24486.1 membrane protein [Microbacterium thalassium]
MNFWEFLVWMFWIYIVISCIWIYITILIDLFRDHTMGGWGKALWVIFLVFLPLLGALIYLIARGRSMSERRVAEAQQAQQATNDYIRTVAGGGKSPTAEIESAKALLDAGTITQADFDAIKTKALQG